VLEPNCIAICVVVVVVVVVVYDGRVQELSA
jgi:hypothetical protein